MACSPTIRICWRPYGSNPKVARSIRAATRPRSRPGSRSRRLFLAGVTLAGLALLVLGSSALFGALLQRLLEVGAPTIHSNWFVVNTASGIGQIFVGAMMARTTWQVWEAIMVRNPGEQLSALRRLFLYVAVIGGAGR